MRLALTNKILSELRPRDREYVAWDAYVAGFGIRVRPSGKMSFIVQARAPGGRKARQVKSTLGSIDKLTLAQARSLAKKKVFEITTGFSASQEVSDGSIAPLLRDFKQQYLEEHVRLKRKLGTYKQYESLLRSIDNTNLASMPIDKISRDHLVKLHASLHQTPIKANRLLATLGAMFGYAAQLALIPDSHNPTRGIERFKESGREVFLNYAQIESLGRAIVLAQEVGIPYKIKTSSELRKHIPKNKPLRRIDKSAASAIKLILLTGCRVGEILQLKWDYLDLERGIATLPDSKTGKKTVFLNSHAITIIEELHRVGPFVFPGLDPQKHRVDLKKPWQIVREIAKMPKVRLHDLRHTFASIGAAEGMGLPIVAKLLGHMDTRMTEKYAHLEDGPVRNASERIGQKMGLALEHGASLISQRTASNSDQVANDN